MDIDSEMIDGAIVAMRRTKEIELSHGSKHCKELVTYPILGMQTVHSKHLVEEHSCSVHIFVDSPTGDL